MKVAKCIIGLAVLMISQLAYSQTQGQNQTPELSIGENTKLSAGALASFGYSGDYGDTFGSQHGLTWGLNGKLSGYYYNPNFISFSATPYYNQSRNNSSYQSLTGASGIDGTANLFTGSHFPGSVSYRYDRNTTGTFGLAGQPNFTTVGKGDGFAVNWSALLPGLPTLSVGYSQGDGSGTLYGTSEETTSSTKLFNVHSNYQIAGFRLNAFFDRNSLHSKFPEFLAGASDSIEDSTGSDVGFGAQHSLPFHGQFFANYNRASAESRYFTEAGQSSNKSDYTDDIVNTGASFHPTQKLSLNVTENYTSNLNGYLSQNLAGTGVPVEGVSLGSGAHSSTVGGGATYQFTNYLSASSQATYYDQYYFGKSYTGAYLSGTMSYGRRLWDMFTFSGSVIETSNGQGTNSLGFIGNVNYFHRIKGWQTSGVFSYAQNVQSLLVTYTTSYYQYSANLHRRLPRGLQWTAAFNGTHSGLTNNPGTNSSGEGYSTSIGSGMFTLTGDYTHSTGLSLLGAGGLVPVTVTPGVNEFITFGGSSYGGGFSVTPARRLIISGSFNRAISNTIGETVSHNNMEIYNAQLQYHLRRIGLQAGYTRFTQGISAVGAPQNTTSYFVGISRWFDFF
ncbi:MAG TPA: hypothetical protein VFE61_32135 [Candidatus Sulfotelmatobacter sp.]|nr:hypothetical protein [Candidatus Sulfotelmatobacter sp.]